MVIINSKIGKFIVIEGPDGCGKSTQVKLLAEKLKSAGENVYVTKEPSEGIIGKFIRSEFLSGKEEIDVNTLGMLFAADRLNHINNKKDGILEKLNSGIHVISDRYYHSSFVYDGYNTSIEFIESINSTALNLLKPDLSILLLTDVNDSMNRVSDRLKENKSNKEIYDIYQYQQNALKRYVSLFERIIADNGKEKAFILNEFDIAENISTILLQAVKKILN